MPVNDRPPGVGLAQAIELVRSELQHAALSGRGSAIGLRPETVDLDFEVVFDETKAAEVGLRVWVTSLGGKKEMSSARTQRLRLTFTPVDATTGEKPLIADEGEV